MAEEDKHPLDDLPKFTRVELGVAFDVSANRIGQMLSEGIISRSGPGGYDFKKVLHQYLRHLRRRAMGNPQFKEEALLRRGATAEDGDDTAFHNRHLNDGQKRNAIEEKARKDAASADAIEMKNAIMRGELVYASEIESIIEDLVGRARAKMIALPSKLAPVLYTAGSALEAQEILENGLNEALEELSTESLPTVGEAGLDEPELVGSGGGDTSEGDEEVEASAEADGEPMGRQLTAAERRSLRRAR